MFRTRGQLLEWLEHHPPTRIVGKAISEGSVELYGLFENIIGDNPAYIVHVTSSRGRKWDVAVAYDKNRSPRSGLLGRVPWHDWAGDQYLNELCIGDYPDLYVQRKVAFILEGNK